jgi:Patatin-like phospholipase
MFEERSTNEPLTFEEVLAQERAVIYSDKENITKPSTALCLSGGGIRAATFALGVIQGLAEKGALDIFDYLSSVSGGGYIGAWLTAWRQRQDRLGTGSQSAAASIDAQESYPLQHLREYNNYLSPKLGLFSADTWTLAATVCRNMFLNWLVLVPLLLLILLIPRLILSGARLGEWMIARYGQAWVSEIRLEYAIAAFAGIMFSVAIFNVFRYLPGVGAARHNDIAFLKYCMAPLVSAALGFITMESWFTGGDDKATSRLTFFELLLWISASALAGWIIYLCTNFKKMRIGFKLILGMTLAIVLTGLSTASCAWFLVSKFYPLLEWETYVTFGPPLLLFAFGLPSVLFVGVTSDVLDDEDREWFSRAGAWLLLLILGWSALCSLVLLAPDWGFDLSTKTQSILALVGSAGGIATALGGYSSRSKAYPVDEGKARRSLLHGIVPRIMPILLQVATAAFAIVFLTSLTVLTNLLFSILGLVPGDWTDHAQFLEDTPTTRVLAAMVVLASFAWVIARFIDINKFSLHAMYRNRLIRAYLGASNRSENVNQFTGFGNSDDFVMHELNARLRPFHVLNITLNLVSGKRLAWQQRKAVPFTVSAKHCGSFHLGYRTSQEYAGGISLGTAMTISGAAASPNMGYYSSPAVGFIMTLFNARLGAWLGNPGKHGGSTWKKQGPESAVTSIVREAFGLTTDDCPYVYLSDGGHFENLGLYEMVRRRCQFIVAVDASADPEMHFGDLGNALRKIRIDMNIDIKFDDDWVENLRSGRKRWAVGTIFYDQTKIDRNGTLIYIKPVLCQTEPPDVLAYHAANPAFPHQSTANQFFNESQTESYRMLGLHTIREMIQNWDPKQSFVELAEQIRNSQPKRQEVGSAASAGG